MTHKRRSVYLWVLLYPMRPLRKCGWTWRFSTGKLWVSLDPKPLRILYRLPYSWWRSRLWPSRQAMLCLGRLTFTRGALGPWSSLNCCRKSQRPLTVKEAWWYLSNSSPETNRPLDVLFWYSRVCYRLLMLILYEIYYYLTITTVYCSQSSTFYTNHLMIFLNKHKKIQ